MKSVNTGPILSREQIQKVEQACIESGIDSVRLMENAGSAAAKFVRTKWDVRSLSVVVVCGNGGNGGDGFVVARKLFQEGCKVFIVLANSYPKNKDAVLMYERISQMDIPVINFATDAVKSSEIILSSHLLVDCIFGISFHGSISDEYVPLFHIIKQFGGEIISVDVPSGLDSNTGETDPYAVSANETVTFTALKKGLATENGIAFAGNVTTLSIGIDPYFLMPYVDAVNIITSDMVKSNFKKRNHNSHKGSYGKLLAVCGSIGMAGAASLSVESALRCGVGMVYSAVPKSIYQTVSTHVKEAVYLVLEEENGAISPSAYPEILAQAEKCDAVLLGCGIGLSPQNDELVKQLFFHANLHKKPIILDADGISILSKHINIIETATNEIIVTPHPGEMARLLNISVSEVEQNRSDVAKSFSAKYGVTVILKGFETLVVSVEKPMLINKTGNAGMAVGGSGDVLAGMIASFVAQGMPAYEACYSAVFLHGLAGDMATEKLSQHAMLPSDMIAEFGKLFLILEK